MHSAISSTLVILALAGWAAADLPRKAPLTKYRNLWDNSPFTSKPVVDGGPPPPNPLDDYALNGVSPVESGYRVTIINKKDPTDRIYVYSNEPDAKHGFRILSVDRKDGDPRATVVHMQSGSQKGTVSYDEKLLTIAAPAAQQAQKPGGKPQVLARPGQPQAGAAVINPNQPGVQPVVQPGQEAPRAPRPRVIGPPPNPSANPQATPQPAPNSPPAGQPNTGNRSGVRRNIIR